MRQAERLRSRGKDTGVYGPPDRSAEGQAADDAVTLRDCRLGAGVAERPHHLQETLATNAAATSRCFSVGT